MKRFRWDKKYLYWGMTAFFVIIASITFFMLIERWPSIWASIVNIVGILSPILWGFAIAYLLSPIMKFFQRTLFDPLGRRIFKKKPASAFVFARGVSVALALLVAFVAVSALLWLVLPQIYFSIESIVISMPEYVGAVTVWFEKTLADFPMAEDFVGELLNGVSAMFVDWARNDLLPQFRDILTNVTSGVFYVVRGLLNILIGAVVSVYVMYSKERFIARGRKLLYSAFPQKWVEMTLNSLSFTNRAFIGFIGGQLLDALIVGVLCYIFCVIAKMPYPLLIAVIICVTNIIPFFGPFIGAIPTAIIVLMESPLKCLIFVIFIIVLQQFDGNVLCPKILGSRTGLSGFWVMFAIIVGGGLFGFLGMLFGVPVFVVLYAGLSHFVNSRLKKHGLPTETGSYEEDPPRNVEEDAAAGVSGGEL